MSAFPLIAYPLDVIKTNRIVGTQAAENLVSESLSRDLVQMMEQGALRNGLYRGALPLVPLSLLEAHR